MFSTTSKSFPKPRVAVTVAFIINGFGAGTFFSRVADYKHLLHATNSQFGLALLGVSAGVLSGLIPGGKLAAKYGSSRVVIPATVLLAFALVIVSLIRNYWELVLALYLYGFSTAVQDVTMNAHAITVENKYQNKYMSAFHGSWSLGSFAAVIFGGVMSQFKVSTFIHASIIAVLSLILIRIYASWFLPAETDIHHIEKRNKIRKPRIFWLLGLIGICGQVGEGAAGDWGSILARDTFKTTPFVGNLPFTLFSLSMLTGRFYGDRLRHKFAERSLLIASGLTTGIGMISAMVFGSIYSEIIGWLIAGAGLSVLIPILFSQTGEIAKRDYPSQIPPSEGVAMVSGIAYSGFMAGPPIIGFLASLFSLRWALLLPGILALLIAFSASKILKK